MSYDRTADRAARCAMLAAQQAGTDHGRRWLNDFRTFAYVHKNPQSPPRLQPLRDYSHLRRPRSSEEEPAARARDLQAYTTLSRSMCFDPFIHGHSTYAHSYYTSPEEAFLWAADNGHETLPIWLLPGPQKLWAIVDSDSRLRAFHRTGSWMDRTIRWPPGAEALAASQCAPTPAPPQEVTPPADCTSRAPTAVPVALELPASKLLPPSDSAVEPDDNSDAASAASTVTVLASLISLLQGFRPPKKSKQKLTWTRRLGAAQGCTGTLDPIAPVAPTLGTSIPWYPQQEQAACSVRANMSKWTKGRRRCLTRGCTDGTGPWPSVEP